MAGLKAESTKWPVPNDWDEAVDGYQFVILCIPNSRTWRGIFTGQVDNLTYGRNWNRHSGQIAEAQEIAQEIFEGMLMVCSEDLIEALNCLCETTTIIAEGAADTGKTIETASSDGEVEVGPGQQFPDQTSYYSAKCNVANGIFDTIRDTVTWLKANNVDLIAGLFGSVTAGLLVAVALSGPVGWAWLLAGSIITGIAGYLVRLSVDFSDLEDALNDTHEECVVALYNAADSGAAEENFIAAVEAGTPSITSVETGLLSLMLSTDMLNQLYSPRGDLVDYESPSPIDCPSFALKVWSFPTDVESFTFRDDSTNNGSAGMTYDGALEALRFELDMPGGITHTKAIGVGVSPAVSIAVTAENSVRMDYSGPLENSYETWKTIKVFYDDATTDEKTDINDVAGTVVMQVQASKTIEKVEAVITLYSGVTAWELHETIAVLEIRIQ